MSSPRTVSWQLLGLQPCSSSPTRTRKSIHLWGSEWRLQGKKSNLASLTRVYFFMHIYSVIVMIMSTKVKVEALVLNTWCFIKRPFLLQSRRNWGLLCVSSCFCAFFHFSFSWSVDPLMKMTALKWFSCLLWLAADWNFKQINLSHSHLRKMSHGWIDRGNKKTDTRPDVNDGPLLLQFRTLFYYDRCRALSVTRDQSWGEGVMSEGVISVASIAVRVIFFYTFGQEIIMFYKYYRGGFCFRRQDNELH